MIQNIFLAVILGSFISLGSADKWCGRVTVCVTPVAGRTHRINMRMKLNSELPGSISTVDSAGYAYNWGTGNTRVLHSPGQNPSTVYKTYIDRWTELTGFGPVEVAFPFMRGYNNPYSFCYGSFKKVFQLESRGGRQCATAGMYRSSRVDFAMLIDTTGSMKPIIEDVKRDNKKIIDSLKVTSSVFRGALVEYNDRNGAPDATVVQTLTTRVWRLKQAINSLDPKFGGDAKECVYDGLMLVLNLPWDHRARKIMVTVGDQPAKVCESGITKADVLAKSFTIPITLEISPSVRASFGLSVRQEESPTIEIPVHDMNPQHMIVTSRRASKNFESLADDTNGTFSECTADDCVVPSIVNVIEGDD